MAILQTWMRYYRLDAYGVPTIDENIQDYIVSADCRKSKGGKSNTLSITLNNPIVAYFSDGTPQRKFVDAYGETTFKAAKASSGYYNFEERLELYAIHTNDASNVVLNDENLIFSGQILSVKVTHTNNKTQVVLTCSDRTFNLLNRIHGNSYQSTATPNIIKSVVQFITEQTGTSVQAYDQYGVLGTGSQYRYTIDARLFSEGLKGGSDSVNATTTKTITVPSATFVTDDVEIGDIVKNTSTNAVAIVKEVVSETSLVLSKAIFTSSANIQVSNGFICDFRPDGSAFPTVSFGLARKPVYEWLEKLVEMEYTNTTTELETSPVVKRPLEFYVDTRNRLHVFYPDDVPSNTIDVSKSEAVSPDTDAHKVYDVDMTKSVFDIVNFVIFKAGQDMENQQILWHAQDPTSGGPIVKDSYRPLLHISERMKFEDRLTNQGNGVYAYPALPRIPNWDRQGRTATSESQYNQYFREEARLRGQAAAFQIINKTANPRYKGSIRLRGENFSVSNLLEFTDKEVGVSSILVRTIDVVHTISNGGWYTRLEVKEDVPEST